MVKMIRNTLLGLWLLILIFSCNQSSKGNTEASKQKAKDSLYYTEDFRPQFHFSPKNNWMNDPNGLVYHKGTYHLFYQHYPEDIIWGPMHWGHATSTDLVHWEHRPIALYPDENGLIFSGSAVVDTYNTSGFGTLENPPLVAIFTYHDMKGEQEGKNDFETQGIAYSLDNGESWSKFEGNPVIGNTGYRDFRDPKVFWNDKLEQWSMLVVAGDHMQVWQSPDLKSWKMVSSFGEDKGAHGGVWECPDLFPLKVAGTDETKWVLLISINPGAPNGGSGTQYFIGDFDGQTFSTNQKGARWIDMGRDNYAGVTYNNVPDEERIFIGWMSNWNYARETPTEKWRSAMTLPRTLHLERINAEYELFNYPVPQVDAIVDRKQTKEEKEILAGETQNFPLPYGNQTEIMFTVVDPNMELVLSNKKGEALRFSLQADEKLAVMDRSLSGLVDFATNFVNEVQEMPMENLPQHPIEVRILLDKSSIEVFVNKGQYVMTNQVFPTDAYSVMDVKPLGSSPLKITQLSISPVARIWD
jgi:fructan beta-fructosidase